MQTAKWSFRPGPAATLATALLLPLLLSLGFWQLDRADEKQALFNDYNARVSAGPVDLNTLTAVQKDDILWRKATLRGKYLQTGVFLLDNQVVKGRVGYHVYALFEPEGDGSRVIVNRGWIAAGAYRDEIPVIPKAADRVTLTGIITGFPSPPGIRLDSGRPPAERMGPDSYRMQTITQASVQALLDQPVSAYVLRLDPASPTGLVREWPEPGSGKERHLGYAFQWFSLAAALVSIYIAVNLKRRKVD